MWIRIRLVFSCVVFLHLVSLPSLSYSGEFTCELQDASSSDTTYYDGIRTRNGATLKQDLSRLISQSKKLRYKEVWDALAITDSDPCSEEHVILLYTGRSHPIVDRNRGGRNQNDTWNREHVWPKSHGFSSRNMPAYTDIHHLRPTDTTVNSSRGHKDFAEGGLPQGEALSTFQTKETWEPRDEVKGDIARMLFYMEVRYARDPFVPQLRLSNSATDSGTPSLGFLCTIYKWHFSDPVNNWEMRRNNLIQIQQGNRNPFIDHPDWVQLIWGEECSSA